MKQHWIVQEGNAELALFFAGWGMDAHPFFDYRFPGKDLMVCFDYRSMDFDLAMLQPYKKISLTAWSMGVWAANIVAKGFQELLSSAVAINGTLFPVDDDWGIPKKIYDGTLEGLNPHSLHKFYLRMCGTRTACTRFLERAPQRGLEELREELQLIAAQSLQQGHDKLRWNKAVIGTNDAIFSCLNQQRAWEGTPTEIIQGNHYDEEVLRKIIGRNG